MSENRAGEGWGGIFCELVNVNGGIILDGSY